MVKSISLPSEKIANRLGKPVSVDGTAWPLTDKNHVAYLKARLFCKTIKIDARHNYPLGDVSATIRALFILTGKKPTPSLGLPDAAPVRSAN